MHIRNSLSVPCRTTLKEHIKMEMIRGAASAVMVVVVMVVVFGPAAVTPSPEAEAAAVAEPCCGRGAAGALGFVGGFVIGRAVGHRHHHHGHHHGCGGCGGGWCGGCGRKRRSLQELMGHEKLEEIYGQIASKDKDQCGLRLVCELAQKDQRELTESEVTILLPFWGLEESDEKSYYGRYDKAVWHGQRGSSCKKLFPRCIYSVPQIMTDFTPDSTGLVL